MSGLATQPSAASSHVTAIVSSQMTRAAGEQPLLAAETSSGVSNQHRRRQFPSLLTKAALVAGRGAAAALFSLPFKFLVGVGLRMYGPICTVLDMRRAAGCGGESVVESPAAAVSGARTSASGFVCLASVGPRAARGPIKASASLAKKSKGAGKSVWVTKGLLNQEAESLYGAQQQYLLSRRKGHCGVDCQRADAKLPRKALFRRQQM